jgi:acylphosphatase
VKAEKPYITAYKIHIFGRVQGVGFRYSTVVVARRLHILGWVRNCEDGCVEAHIEGTKADLERMLSWFTKGPPGAHVTRVERSETPALGTYQSFSVEY